MTKRQNFYEFQLDRKGRKQKRLCAVLKKKTEPQFFLFKVKKKRNKYSISLDFGILKNKKINIKLMVWLQVFCFFFISYTPESTTNAEFCLSRKLYIYDFFLLVVSIRFLIAEGIHLTQSDM